MTRVKMWKYSTNEILPTYVNAVISRRESKMSREDNGDFRSAKKTLYVYTYTYTYNIPMNIIVRI